MTKRVAVIIPAFNEAKMIGKVVGSLPKRIEKMPVTTIVVDDESTDRTADLAKAAGATVIRHLFNLGAGGATATGLEYARENGFDYVVTMDADGQHAAEDCRKVLSELRKDKCDLVIGSRLIDASGMPVHRIVGNKGLNFITYLIFRTTVTDTQSGLKGFSRRAVQLIDIRTTGMEFCSEIIWRAKQRGLDVVEVPIQAIYTDYSKEKGQSSWNAFNIIKNLVKRRLLELISA